MTQKRTDVSEKETIYVTVSYTHLTLPTSAYV